MCNLRMVLDDSRIVSNRIVCYSQICRKCLFLSVKAADNLGSVEMVAQ